ncbi:hypothetical protein KP509_19G053300 [Ceratopteris richardii]|nr:hypothetical protein KP509_19G053300 [Ceratopteris richardii]
MYLKLETICVEVDKNPSLLLQETSKYVENHVNAVGTNVKKLCAEFIHDLLSPEVGEKKLECALHCKCHCMDNEMSKSFGSNVVSKKKDFEDVPKNYESVDSAVSQRQENFEKINNTESHASTHASKAVRKAPEINNSCKAAMIEKPPTLIGRHQVDESSRQKTFQGGVFVNESILEHESQDEFFFGNESLEASCRNVEEDKAMRANEESVHAAECKLEVNAVGQENGTKEISHLRTMDTDIGDGKTKILFGFEEESSAFGRCQPQILVGVIDGFSEKRLSDIGLQDAYNESTECCLEIDHSYDALSHISTFSIGSLETDKVKIMDKSGGHFQSFTIRDFSESIKEEDLICMSEYFSKDEENEEQSAHWLIHGNLRGEEDEEQSAHWLIHENLRDVLQPEIFGVEESCQQESFCNDLDLDWELL